VTALTRDSRCLPPRTSQNHLARAGFPFGVAPSKLEGQRGKTVVTPSSVEVSRDSVAKISKSERHADAECSDQPLPWSFVALARVRSRASAAVALELDLVLGAGRLPQVEVFWQLRLGSGSGRSESRGSCAPALRLAGS